MNLILAFYNDLKETYGAGPTLRALCACGGISLLLLALLLKPEQPIIMIQEISKEG